jgi:flagella basal body P-ring formation protein FlgA
MKLLLFLALCFIPSQSRAADITAKIILKRGTILTKNDISVTLKSGENMNVILEPYLGQQLTRAVYIGHKIQPHYLSAPVLIKRNEQVNMIYTFGTMRLSAKGRALQAGAKGETITVMNVSSRIKIMAVVLANNIVEVN